MERKNKLEELTLLDAIIEQIITFHSLTDMIIYLIGYIEDLLIYAEKGNKEMEVVFSDKMISKQLIKAVAKQEKLEDMETYLKEYCRLIIEKAINIKSKRLYEHYMSYSKEERCVMIGVNPKEQRSVVPSNNKGTLATVFGAIRYTKYGVYVPTIRNSSRVFAPIDDFLNVISGLQYPKEVLKKIGHLVTKVSYQEAAEILNNSNIAITKQSVWNLTRDIIAPRVFDYEKEKTLDYLLGNKNKDTEKKQISTLFIEWDGVWLSLDNTKDESQKTGKKQEMKLGKAYIGWAEKYGAGENTVYRTEGTRYVAGFEAPETLRTMLNGKIDEVFDYANVKQIIVNGDGANWIFQDYDLDARVTLQLDMFHIVQKIHRCIKDNELKTKVLKLVDGNQFLEITELLRKEIEAKSKTEDVKKLKTILEYLENNFGALRRYQKVVFVKLENGLKARNLGTMEASVRQVIGRRMRVSAWSLEGARAMAAMLCLEHEGKLEEVLDKVLNRDYKMKYSEINLDKFIQEYREKEDKEMMKHGQEANKKIIARGKYAKALVNIDINFKELLKKNNTAAKYIPKSIF